MRRVRPVSVPSCNVCCWHRCQWRLCSLTTHWWRRAGWPHCVQRRHRSHSSLHIAALLNVGFVEPCVACWFFGTDGEFDCAHRRVSGPTDTVSIAKACFKYGAPPCGSALCGERSGAAVCDCSLHVEKSASSGFHYTVELTSLLS